MFDVLLKFYPFDASLLIMAKKKTATVRSTKTGKKRIPEVGDVFVYQIKGRVLGACRVLQHRNKFPPGQALMRKQGGWFLVAISAWIGKKMPRLEEPLLRKILRLTHHSWRNEAQLCWASGRPPADWTWLGSIPPAAKEQKLKCNGFGYWTSGTEQALTQWRWDHDREALLRDKERETKALVRKHNAAAKAELAKLAATPLAELRDRKHFSRWRPFALPGAISNSERIMRETIDALIEPHAAKNKKGMLQALQDGVAKFNTLQSEKHCLLTIEGDDVVDKFDQLFQICGLKSKIPLLMQWIKF